MTGLCGTGIQGLTLIQVPRGKHKESLDLLSCGLKDDELGDKLPVAR